MKICQKYKVMPSYAKNMELYEVLPKYKVLPSFVKFCQKYGIIWSFAKI